jgi:N-acetylneuraminate synthase
MNKNKKIFIVAEAGVNHNGSVSKALDLIDAAAYAGADAVKFQTFVTEKMITKNSEKANYQKRTTVIKENQFEMIKKLELNFNSYFKLKNRCRKNNIKFLSTAFDYDSLNFLVNKLKLDVLKIPSGEIINGPYLLEHAKYKKKLIVSTGMSTINEVETCLGVIAFGLLNKSKPSKKSFQNAYKSKEGKRILSKYVTLLHCTSNYPAKFSEINLNAMIELKNKFGLAVGYSDHSKGTLVSISAAAMGARYIEKHFTLDKNLPGPDHLASLEPDELKLMVTSIRNVEIIRGSKKKIPQASEINVQKVARRSIVATKKIRKGDIINENNIGLKRPASGKNPMDYWKLIGQTSKKNYDIDENI